MRLIVTIILSIIIIIAVNQYRLQYVGRRILISPKNDLVNEYIYILKFTLFSNKTVVWREIKSVFMKVYTSNNISKELKDRLYIELIKKGFNIDPNNQYSITNEEKIRKSGEEGEKNVAYKLKWLSKDYKVLKNIRLKSEVESQEFDNIVIGPNGIFHIETKNYGGEYGCKIKIDNLGNWIKESNGKEFGIDSPEFQLRRHEMVIQENLRRLYSEREYNVRGIIVLSNPKTIIEGTENLEIPVIKADGLCKYIEGIKADENISSEEIADIYNKLKENN